MGENPGYVFKPTNKELLYFLRRKLRRESLPLDVFKECDIYGDKDPWELFDKTSTESFYVFTKLKRKGKSRTERTAGCGTWSNKQSSEIKDGSKKIVGFDRYFVFQVRDASTTDIDTNGYWTMHEFSLLSEQVDDYVLCVISYSSQKAKKRKLNQEQENHKVKKMRVTSTMDNIDLDDKKDNGEASVPPSNLISEPTSELEPAWSSDLGNFPLSTLITDQPAPSLYMEPTSMSYDYYTAYDNEDAYVPPSNLISEPTSELEPAWSSELDNFPLSTLITDQPAPSLYMEPTSMPYDYYNAYDNEDGYVPPSNLISEPTLELEPASSSDLDNLPLSTLITDQPAPAQYVEPLSYDNYTAYEALPQSSFNLEQWTPMMYAFDPQTIEAIEAALQSDRVDRQQPIANKRVHAA